MPERPPQEEEQTGEILAEIRPSRKRFVQEYSVFSASLILSALLLFTPLKIPFEVKFVNLKLFASIFFLVTAFFFLAYAEIRRYIEYYELTETGAFEEIGYFDKRSINLPYAKLERCGVEEPLMRRIMGIGDVRVDAGRDYFIIQGVEEPKKVRDLIREGMRRAMRGNPAVVNE